MDSTRLGLKQLGFEDDEIERDFVPAIALRNYIGVGHVFIALLSREQLKIIHSFAERAEDAFRRMLQNLFEMIDAGDDLDIPPYELRGAREEVNRIIETMSANAPPDAR